LEKLAIIAMAHRSQPVWMQQEAAVFTSHS